MQATDSIIIDLRQEEVDDARRLSVAQKLALGGDLFDAACAVTLSGIRTQNPGISHEDALVVLCQRLALARKMEMRL